MRFACFQRVTGWLICCSVLPGCADLTVALCQIMTPQGTEALSVKPDPSVKRWSRYRVQGDVFVDLRYEYVDSAVAVRTVYVPHYPWTIGERVLDRRVLHLPDNPSLAGVLALEKVSTGDEMECKRSNLR